MGERSVSLDDNDSDRESSSAPGKPGRKKNPNSQAARRDQNRIAQREFRLRKQQKIRDLETRVEILSGGTDQAVTEMKNMLKDLMEENQTLRTLLRSLGAFIGEGAGGLLPKLGWDLADFNNFINRSETDTAWQGYQRRKKAGDSASSMTQGQKRSADDDSTNSRKKTRANDHDADPNQNGYPVLVNMNPPMASNNMYGRESPNNLFSDLMRGGNGSPMFSNPSPTTNPAPGFAAGSQTNYQNTYMSGVNMGVDSSLPALSFSPPAPAPPAAMQQQPQTNQMSPPDQAEEDDDPNKSEAYKLIHYHLDNYKRNTAYCLPSSLRPTLVQRTVPHESVIDRILHPELRDRMILLRGRFDLVDCLLDYRNAVTIHGDDVLAHSNWEISEKWLRQYGFLVDPATLNIVNRWRRERAEPELRIADITSAENTPASTS
ncbi:hypothetical protein C8F04DRAFT_1059263 [Mycena alexandri]|uniref:BZIP domain-containing protein n=1 Tax=Mycena alexandri TaxID=1745969 RepID=A0AAD6TL11_9AGAR|nr:hypothetical protein C8F04DRAFT_1059263 [Mycena alexandri]